MNLEAQEKEAATTEDSKRKELTKRLLKTKD
jgi:hypothetical protein